MSHLAHLLLPIGLPLAVTLAASPAGAHIRLLKPEARYEITGFETGIKSCPCGMGPNTETCNVAQDGSDPNRASNRVTVLQAGSTITVRFEELVDHAGRFRIAFDPDGADVEDFNANVLLDVPDPADVTSNTDEEDIWEVQVELPEMTCDNCTLQLVQVMNNDTANPVADPSNQSTYYACADIELVGSGDGGSGDGGSSNPNDGEGTGGAEAGGGTGDSSGGFDGIGDPGDPGDDSGASSSGSNGSSGGGGCQLSASSVRPGAALVLAFGLVTAWGCRRRRALVAAR